MLVRSVIYGVGFDFMHPFQKGHPQGWPFTFPSSLFTFTLIQAHDWNSVHRAYGAANTPSRVRILAQQS